jgi:hypothetical protein
MPQPDLILADSIEAYMNHRFNPGFIAFRGEDTVVTSFAIWDLNKGERLKSCTGSFERRAQTLFSSSGERAVRANLISRDSHGSSSLCGDYELEVLDTRDDVPISVFEVQGCDSLLPRAISHSGRRIVCSTASPSAPGTTSMVFHFPRHICFLVNSATTVDLECPVSRQMNLEFAQFTHDEEALVGCLTTRDEIRAGMTGDRGRLDSWPVIALWNIAESNTGCVPISRLFRSPRLDFTFCLAPKTHQPLHDSDSELIIINDSGAITRRALNQLWSEEGEEGLESHFPGLTCFLDSEGIKIIPGRQALTINLILWTMHTSKFLALAFVFGVN